MGYTPDLAIALPFCDKLVLNLTAKMKKYEKALIYYLPVICTLTVILNLAILRKKPLLINQAPAGQPEISPTPKTNYETIPASDAARLSSELENIKNELSLIRAVLREQKQTLGDNQTDIEDILAEYQPEPTVDLKLELGYVSLRSLALAQIYKESNYSSPSVGKIIFGENYPYFQKKDGWYYLKNQDFTGWINGSLVKEIN